MSWCLYWARVMVRVHSCIRGSLFTKSTERNLQEKFCSNSRYLSFYLFDYWKPLKHTHCKILSAMICCSSDVRRARLFLTVVFTVVQLPVTVLFILFLPSVLTGWPDWSVSDYKDKTVQMCQVLNMWFQRLDVLKIFRRLEALKQFRSGLSTVYLHSLTPHVSFSSDPAVILSPASSCSEDRVHSGLEIKKPNFLDHFMLSSTPLTFQSCFHRCP